MTDTATIPAKGWSSIGHAIAFWVLAGIGIPIMIVAWFLLPLASLEEVTEQPKALAAGTTMAGTTFWLGVAPLVVAHVIGLAVLCSIGASGRHDTRVGLWFGAGAVAVASIIGLVVTLVVSGGQLIVTPPAYVP